MAENAPSRRRSFFVSEMEKKLLWRRCAATGRVGAFARSQR
jgi:hypothetical protein